MLNPTHVQRKYFEQIFSLYSSTKMTPETTPLRVFAVVRFLFFRNPGAVWTRLFLASPNKKRLQQFTACFLQGALSAQLLLNSGV